MQLKNWSGVFTHIWQSRPGRGKSHKKSDENAHRKIKIKLLRYTNVGVAQALTDPL